MSRLVSSLKNRYATGYYKHGCHHLDIDREGKDSSVVREVESRFPLMLRHASGNDSLRPFLEDYPVHYLAISDPYRLQSIDDPAEEKPAKKTLLSGKRKKQ